LCKRGRERKREKREREIEREWCSFSSVSDTKRRRERRGGTQSQQTIQVRKSVFLIN